MREKTKLEKSPEEKKNYSELMNKRQDKKVVKRKKKYKKEVRKRKKAKYKSDHFEYVVVYLLFLFILSIPALIIFFINNMKYYFELTKWFIIINSIFYFNGEIREKKFSTYLSAWITFIFFNYPINYLIIDNAWIFFTENFQNVIIFLLSLLCIFLFLFVYIPKIYVSSILRPLIQKTRNYFDTYINYEYKIIRIITNRFEPLIERHNLSLDHKYYLKEIRKKCVHINNNIDREHLIDFGKKYYFSFDTTAEGEIRIRLNDYYKFEDNEDRDNFLKCLSKLETLIELSIVNFGIDNLNIFEEFKDLRYLDLSSNEITSIIDMYKFPNLFSLNLSHNKINKIQNLEILKHLENLNLSNNFLECINGLNSLYNLKQLDISENHISEIPRLKENFEIRKLNLSNNEINEIKNLEVLENLRQLDLSNNNIKEIKNLDNNLYLKILNLSNNAITEIKNLEALNHLIRIDLSNNSITELKGLGINSLREWNLDNNLLKGDDLIALNYSRHEFIKYNLEKKIQIKRLKKMKEINSIELTKKSSPKFQFDFAFSFAGEDREEVEKIKNSLMNRGFNIFYDKDFEWYLAGKDLNESFKEIYGKNSKYVIAFISKRYSVKKWTDFERQIAEKAAESREEEYIIPVRLDDTITYGIKSTIGYIDYHKKGTRGIADILEKKLKDFNKRHCIK